jgi:hypothetical protein
MATQNEPVKQAEAPQKATLARTRSPAYPSMNLAAAVERASSAYSHIKRNAVEGGTFADVWDLNLKSSTLQLSLSTLKKFGLLDEVTDSKPKLFKLSSMALNLIIGDQDPNSPERVALLKQAALLPKIHAELWAQYGGDLPSDIVLRRGLLLQKGFNDDAVDGFIKNFRDTISFAKLSPSDKIVLNNAGQNESDDAPEETIQTAVDEKPQGPKVTTPTVMRGAPPAISETIQMAAHLAGGSSASGAITVLREFNFPLPTGMAALRVPYPLTEEDYESLLKTLKNFKDGLVKKEIAVVDTNIPGSEQNAESLAQAGIEFNLLNFSYSHDIGMATKLARDHGFKLRLDINKGIAFFRKKEEN